MQKTRPAPRSPNLNLIPRTCRKQDPIHPFRLKKSFKRLLTVLFILIIVLLICYFAKLKKTDTRKNVNEEPLAVFSHVEPADDKYINRKGM